MSLLKVLNLGPQTAADAKARPAVTHGAAEAIRHAAEAARAAAAAAAPPSAAPPTGGSADAAGAASPATRKPAPEVNPSLTFNDSLDSDEFGKWGDTSHITGGFKFKGSLKLELQPHGGEGRGASLGYTTNKGAKGDVELAKNTARDLVSSLRIAEDKCTVNWELSGKQVKVSVQMKVTFQSKVSWLAPVLVFEFVGLAVDWKKVKEDIGSVTVVGIEAGGGLKGSGTVNLRDKLDLKLSVDAVCVGTLKPNWKKISIDVGERIALEFAKGAGSAAVGGTGGAGSVAVASAPVAGILGGIVGGIALCAASMHAIEVLGQQGRDSFACAQEGARRLRAYADSFAATVRGGSGPSPEGNQDGEAHLQNIMRVAQTTREDAVAMCRESDQKYEQMAWVALRPKMREAVQEAYNRLHWGDINHAVLMEFLGDRSNY